MRGLIITLICLSNPGFVTVGVLLYASSRAGRRLQPLTVKDTK